MLTGHFLTKGNCLHTQLVFVKTKRSAQFMWIIEVKTLSALCCIFSRWTVQPISIVRAGVLNYAINLRFTCMPNNVVGSIRWTDPLHPVTSLTYETSLYSLGELLTSDCMSRDPSLTWPLSAAVSEATWMLLPWGPQIATLSKKLFSHKTLTLTVSTTIRFNGSSLGIPLTSFLHS